MIIQPGLAKIEGFVKIHDPKTGEILLDKKNAIHYENISICMANMLADKNIGYIYQMAFGNGGSAANASHFATDLGKGSSDKLPRRFRVLSLNDNVSWLTALGNDYAYDQIFVRQMANYARPGDLLLTMSVSGNSPNLVKAIEWGNAHQLETIALVGAKRGRLAELAKHVEIGRAHV